MDRNTIEKIIIGFFIAVCVVFVIEVTNIRGLLTNSDIYSSSSRMNYGRFLNYIELGWVKQVDLYENSRNALVLVSSPELGNRPQVIRVDIPVGASQLVEKLKDYNINFDSHPIPEKSIVFTIASNLILPLLFLVGLIFFFRNSDGFSQNGGLGPLNFGTSTARYNQNLDTGIFFKDIAGIDEAKDDFEEIVSFLKEPERYTRVGAEIPKGVLLMGPPGTGKTLLAKAIANEARVPFYNISGSEFVEMFIGIGASRIRDLFKKASETTPCIVFIDEIDAVGRERGAGIGGGNDEREQTLNQLLTEMDGFKENKGIIVVGATNRMDILDPALLRPGRFDRLITVGFPDRAGRLGILKIHARNKPLTEEVSLTSISNRTPGFAGADLANILNESAILATRYAKQKITKNEVNEAIDRILGGIVSSSMEDTKNKRLIAYHEVGHAIVASLLEKHDEVEKVSVIPRGSAKGVTWFTSEDDQILVTRSQLLQRIMTILGGRMAEIVVFGQPELSTGATNDLEQCTKIARQMVTRYGMSGIGPRALENNTNDRLFSDGKKNPLSDRIDKEVHKIVKSCEYLTMKIILDNRVIMDLLVDKLLEYENMNGDDLRKIVIKYTLTPRRINHGLEQKR